MSWYLVREGARVGPLADGEFEEQVRTNRIGPQTLVWRDGMVAWQPLIAVRGAAEAAADAPVPCAECARLFSVNEVIRHGSAYICAGCKPVFLQKLREGLVPTGLLQYAGFGVRFGAKVIDGLLLGVVNVGIQLAVMGPAFLQPKPNLDGFWVRYFLAVFLSTAVSAGYTIFLHGKYGATLGKRAVRVKVVRANGQAIGYSKATVRYFAEFLSSFTLLIGYLMAAFDEERRALHDRICDTRVIRI